MHQNRRHTTKKLTNQLITFVLLAFVCLSGCSGKTAIKTECVAVKNYRDPEGGPYTKAERTYWNDGTVTYKKRDCGVWDGEYLVYLDEEPKP